jgi:aminoglycoside 6'-N-acetyltransferase I
MRWTCASSIDRAREGAIPMMSDNAFRDIRPGDIRAIASSYVETYAKEPWSEEWDSEIALYKVEDLVTNPIALCYGAFSGDEFIGGLFGRRNYFKKDKELFVDEFFVDWRRQRQGFGKRLLDFAASDLAGKGYSCIVLNTERGFPSEKFYLENGFKTLESMIMMFREINL